MSSIGTLVLQLFWSKQCSLNNLKVPVKCEDPGLLQYDRISNY